MTGENSEARAVVQADRDAAWPWRMVTMASDCGQERWHSGEFDNNYLVQAFARYRIATEEAVAAEMPTIPVVPVHKSYQCYERGIIYLTPETHPGSYLLAAAKLVAKAGS